MNLIGLLRKCECDVKHDWFKWGAEYNVHTKLLTEFETLGVMGENNSGIINKYIQYLKL